MSVTVEPDSVATYIRWSTEEQGEGTTLEVQRQACSQYILSQGWLFREQLVYVDDGYSGGSLERPGLTALRKAVQRGEVTCVVVFKLDRLSRSVVDTVQLVLQEWEGCCYLKSAREPVDTTSPTGKVFFYMLASYAEWERSVIRERTLAGKIRRAQEGKNPGISLPYGYTRGSHPGEMVVDEGKAALVRRIFREYLGGYGGYQIARRFNLEGIPATRGGRWHKASVEHILRNRAYTGVLAYGKTKGVPREMRRKVGRANLIFAVPRHALVENAFPPLVSQEEFDRAQRLRAQRGEVSGKRALSAEYLLSGAARCRCGAPLCGQAYSRGRYRYYRCSALMHAQIGSCDAGGLPAEPVEARVLAVVRQALSPASNTLLVQRHLDGRQARIGELEASRREAQAGLSAFAEKRRRLDRDYDAGELPARLYASRVDGLEAEEIQLRERVAQLDADLAHLRGAQLDVEGFVAEAERVDAWAHLTPEQRKQLLRFLVEKLTVYRRHGGQNRKRNDHPIEIDLTLRRTGRPAPEESGGPGGAW